jgi:hypothetical protein
MARLMSREVVTWPEVEAQEKRALKEQLVQAFT